MSKKIQLDKNGLYEYQQNRYPYLLLDKAEEIIPGKSDRRVFKLKDSAPKGSFSNPILISGDIIVVNKNILGKATTAISEIGSPVVNAYGIYKIFD